MTPIVQKGNTCSGIGEAFEKAQYPLFDSAPIQAKHSCHKSCATVVYITSLVYMHTQKEELQIIFKIIMIARYIVLEFLGKSSSFPISCPF